MENTEVSRETFEVKYGGERHDIDANVLLNSLLNILAVFQEANRQIDPLSVLELKVQATREGSFIVEMAVTAVVAGWHLTGTQSAKHAWAVVKTTFEAYKLWRDLRGEPKAVGTPVTGGIEFRDVQGNAYIFQDSTVNLYNDNPKVQKALAGTFGALGGSPDIASLELAANDLPAVKIEQAEFESLAKVSAVEDTQVVIRYGAILTLVSPVLKGRGQWTFQYCGKRISASIEDQDFLERVTSRTESFAAEDCLNVDLEITQERVPSIDAFINKSYRVLKVNRHYEEPKSEQSSLFLEP